MAGADRGEGLAGGSDDVDHAPGRDVTGERATSLGFEVGPGLVRYRRELSMQVLHDVLLILPISSEPLATAASAAPSTTVTTVDTLTSFVAGAAADGRSSSIVADGTKNSDPVTALEKSRIRS